MPGIFTFAAELQIRAIATPLQEERKVRTSQSSAPSNGWDPLKGIQTAPQKITVSTDVGIRVKTCGKSTRYILATIYTGKPCAMKCPIGRRLRTARPMPAGRQIKRHSDVSLR